MDVVKEITEMNARLLSAISAGDPERTVELYDEEARFLPFGDTLKVGKAEIGAGYAHLMRQPGFEMGFTSERILASASGDMALDTGRFAFRTAGDAPIDAKGKYMVVWRKDAAGDWKIVGDAINTDE